MMTMMEKLMPNLVTILLTVALIIAFNSHQLLSQAKNFDECSELLNAKPTTTSGRKFENYVIIL